MSASGKSRVHGFVGPYFLPAALAIASPGCTDDDAAADPSGVEVRVDAAGVPHVYADDDLSLFYASGYLQAEARLAQMVLVRRRALGRQAEVLGSEKVDEDELSRIMNFRDLGAADIEQLRLEHPDEHALVVAWVRGVNAYIEELAAGQHPIPTGLGPEGLDLAPELWSAEDVGAIAKLLMFGNSNSLENELLTTVLTRFDDALFDKLELPRPAYPVFTVPESERPAVTGRPSESQRVTPSWPEHLQSPDAKDLASTVAGLRRLHETLAEFSVEGSNNWAVAGTHTTNGRPLLANDPHQPLTSPAIIYAQHLDSRSGGGSFAAAGFSFVGTPGVQLGQTGEVAWAATTGTADVMDLWSVTLDDSTTVRVGDGSATVVSREELIEVAGQATRTLVVDDVPGYGVLLGDALLLDLGINEEFVAGAGRRLLLNWTGFQPTRELHAFFGMSRARSVDDFLAAANEMQVGTFNWTFADADSIAYRSRVLVPDRGDPAAMPTPFLMLDGDDARGFWTGAYLAEDQLPGSRDPAQGYLMSCNNDPFGFTVDGDVHNDPFYFGSFFLPGFRAQRADTELRRLIGRGDITVTDMQALQMDNYATEADLIVPVLGDAWAGVGVNPELTAYEGRQDLAQIVTTLESWDRHMNGDAGEAIAFYVFAHELSRATIGDEMSLVFDAVVGAAPAFPLKFSALTVTGGYPRGDELLSDSLELTVLQALDATATILQDNFGTSDVTSLRWDEAHVTAFESSIAALDWGEVGTAGSVGTLNQATSRYLDDDGNVAGRFISKAGPMFRSVVEFDDDGTPRLHYTFAPGNGGDPEGDHWGDLVEDWVAGRYVTMPFERSEVEAATASRRTLEVPDLGAIE